MRTQDHKQRKVFSSSIILIIMSLLLCLSFSSAETESIISLPELMIEPETALISNDPGTDLAEEYIMRKMYSGKPEMLRVSRPSGSRLAGAERYLYQALVPLITSVADGNRGGTVFSFPVNEVYEKQAYTAQDLGVESILLTSNGQTGFRKSAVEAINAIVTGTFSQKKVLDCLMADFPYEMYWYDKSVGNLLQYPKVEGGYNEDGEAILKITGMVTFNMAVASEYRKDNAAPREFNANGQTIVRYCDIDTRWGQSVALAVENARAIVDKYESCDDYERLAAYKDEIKLLTGYNADAANPENNVLYGNPWQLIWVFDEDPNTKVVCEGFSKAFQYLNDLSESSVTVICAIGTMDGGSHMWNIVHMDDDQNYLADITNCYKDSSGIDYLFLAGGSLIEGTNDGYSYAFGNGYADYVYDKEKYGIRDEEELRIASIDYLAAKPETPIFSVGEERDTFQIGSPLCFTYEGGSDQIYDSFFVKVTYTSSDGTKKVYREEFSFLGDDTKWYFGDKYHMAGTYAVQFAGRCSLYTSLWTEAVELTPKYIADLGEIGFTEKTMQSLSGVCAGDEGYLEWNTADVGLEEIKVELTEVDGMVQYEAVFAPTVTNTTFSWTVCPGEYTLSIVPKVTKGYAYSANEQETITVVYSGKEWKIDGERKLIKYFGISSKPSVPEEMDGLSVDGICAYAFERSKAREVTIPSTVQVDRDAFSGSDITTIYGYERSEAERVAKETGILFVSLGIKPAVPICRPSSVKGYTGYCLAIRLEEETDAVRIRETGETIICDGSDVLIPLKEAGEVVQYSLSAIKNGVRGDYGEPVTLCVHEAGTDALRIPDRVREIEEEAFRNVRVSKIVIPESVCSVGAYAFAGNPDLQIVEIANAGILDETALDQCNETIFCFGSVEAGFDSGRPFLVSR